ncbi:MAG: hypothetical protein ACKO0Z_18250 [Betaproteobacteria bacterium]
MITRQQIASSVLAVLEDPAIGSNPSLAAETIANVLMIAMGDAAQEDLTVISVKDGRIPRKMRLTSFNGGVASLVPVNGAAGSLHLSMVALRSMCDTRELATAVEALEAGKA